MEFGIFIQTFVPKFRRENDPDAEHRALMNDIECAIAADRAGFKYVWTPEHHFLDEYSHLSANEVMMGYLAHATQRIHLGAGIFNPLPQLSHPVKVAERVAMLDHLSGGRFEFGTGRGAGSHEMLAFLPGMSDLSRTREIWEDVIAIPEDVAARRVSGLSREVLVDAATSCLAEAMEGQSSRDVVRRRLREQLRDGSAERTRRPRIQRCVIVATRARRKRVQNGDS
jgi:alkanesulfonate monooxygenase SsuD/methylene tetrahydromethanopterin reductase-like flavin-dependent oxidoreductase (luciferase family)